MRWALPIASSLFARPITADRRRSYCSPPSSSSLSRELALSDQIIYLLQTLPTPPLVRSLDLIYPLLTPHALSSSLSRTPDFLSAFRLFLWASPHKRLRSWHSLHLIVSSFLLDPTTRLASSWDLLQEVHDLGRPLGPLAFVALIRAYSASGSPDLALAAFARMPEFAAAPDTFAYNTVLDLLIKQGTVFLAVALYYQMLKLGCSPNRATFGILIRGLCDAGMTDDALKLFDEMERSGIHPDVMIYTLVLSAFCSKNCVDDAKAWVGTMRKNNCLPDFLAHNVMLSGYCKAGRMDEAFEQLNMIREEGFALGVHGYSALIDGLFRVKRFEEACHLYEEMLEKNVQPDCILYTIMIRGYCEMGRVEEAFSFLAQMTESGVAPDTYCYNTLIKGLCDAGYLDKARSLKLEISRQDLFPDSTTYTIMICGLCKEGLVLEAQEIFHEMQKLGCSPTVNTFNALISGLCKSGKLKDARSLFDKMKIKPSLFLRLSQGINPVRDSKSLRKMVEQLCEAGLVVKAYKLLKDIMNEVVPDVFTYNIMINSFFKVGRPDDALRLLKELQLSGISPDEVTRATVIDGLAKVNREEDAWAIYQRILKNRGTPSMSICNTLMRMLCQKKKVSQAVNLWLAHISQKYAGSEESKTTDVIRDHFDQGCIEDMVKGLIEMARKGGSVGPSPYTIWLIGFCQARQVNAALKIFTTLREFNIEVSPPSCVFLIHSLCSEGHLIPALDVMFYALRSGFILDQHVGNHLLRKLRMANKMKEAHELVWKMSLAGYDMRIYLHASTKELLYNQIASLS